MTADCVTLWVGDALGPLERACLRSVLRQGHTLALYCYGELGGIPEGVEIRDASEILPQSAIVRHKSGSVALFSDWFRFELQRRALGTWIDTDNYLISPLDMKRPYLFGKQMVDPPAVWRRQREMIAAGVLRLPPDSPMLPPLLELFEAGTTPDWLPWYWKVRRKVGSWIGRTTNVSRLPWGIAGPFAVAALAERYGLSAYAAPSEVFNPVPWYEARWILEPKIALEDVVTERTVGVHLSNECIKAFKNEPAPAGSFLERLHREGA